LVGGLFCLCDIRHQGKRDQGHANRTDKLRVAIQWFVFGYAQRLHLTYNILISKPCKVSSFSNINKER
jgi:hypothetical protein